LNVSFSSKEARREVEQPVALSSDITCRSFTRSDLVKRDLGK